MKVTDLKENEVIHCVTLEEAEQIRDLLKNEGMKTAASDSHSYDNISVWEGMCFRPFAGQMCSLNFWSDVITDLKVYYPSDFITPDSTTPKHSLTAQEVRQKLNEAIEETEEYKEMMEMLEFRINLAIENYQNFCLIDVSSKYAVNNHFKKKVEEMGFKVNSKVGTYEITF